MAAAAVTFAASPDHTGDARRGRGAGGRVLVVEASPSRGALAAVRGLGRGDWSTGVAAPEPGPAAVSRYCGRFHRLPHLDAGARTFADAVAGALCDGAYDVVLPAGDAELLALSGARDRLPAALPVAPHASLLIALDKKCLHDAARDAGLEAPRTWLPREPPPAGVQTPFVVKPRMHFDERSPALRRPAALAGDPASVAAAIARIERAGGQALLQERVRGRLMAWTGLLDDDGRLVVCMQQEAERTHPAAMGVTARGVTVVVSPELTVAVLELLRRLAWTGLAQLQFIVPPDGRPRLIDLNARLYGSLALAIAAGVNFPALWAAVAAGRAPGPVEARAGVRYQWLEGDVRQAFAGGRTGALRDLARAVRWSVTAHHSVLEVADARPATAYAGDAVRRSARVALRTAEELAKR